MRKLLWLSGITGLLLFSTNLSVRAQISNEFIQPGNNTGDPFAPNNTNSGQQNPFPNTTNPNQNNGFNQNEATPPQPSNFPSFPGNSNRQSPWRFQDAQGFFQNNTSGAFGNSSTTSFFSTGNNNFGNSDDCGVSIYAEGVGGKDNTFSTVPNEIDLRSDGYSVRAGARWNPSKKCLNPNKLIRLEEQKVNSQNANTCLVSLTTLQMNGKEPSEFLKEYCKSFLPK